MVYKTLSVLIIITLLLTSLSSIMNPTSVSINNYKLKAENYPTVYVSTQFVINSTTVDPITGQKGLYGFSDNVVITSTGNLTVNNATLYFISDQLSPVTLTIQSGGVLYLNHAILTTEPDRYAPTLNFTIIDNGGTLIIKNSRISYPGWFNISNSNIYIINSTFSSPSPNQISMANDFGYQAQYDYLINHGPVPYLYNDQIFINGGAFMNLPSWVPSNTILPVITGTGNLITNKVYAGQTVTVLKTFSFPMSLFPYLTFYNATLTINYTTSSLNSTGATIYPYFKGVTTQPLPSLSPSIKPTSYTWNLISFSRDIFLVNQSFFETNGNIFINVTGPKVGYITINSITINLSDPINYNNQNDFYLHNFNLINSVMYAKDLFISLNSTYVNGNPQKNMIFMQNSQAYILNFTIINTTVNNYDPPYWMDSNSAIYLYRYAVFKLYNFNNEPISGVNISVSPDILNQYQGTNVVLSNSTVNQYNTILYSKFSISNSFKTNLSGIGIVPLFSDIVQMQYWPNALYGGNYLFNLSLNGRVLRNMEIGLPPFPNLYTKMNYYLIPMKIVIPQIIVTNVTSSMMMIHNHNYTITAKIKVYGGNLTNVPVQFKLPGFIKTVYANLYTNRTNNVSVNYIVPDNIVPGNYTLNVTVNPTKSILESNYSGDYYVERITIYPDVEIAISSIKFPPIVLYSNLSINITVSNLGTDPTGQFEVYMRLLGPNMNATKTWYISLNGKSSIILNYRFTPTNPGYYYAYVKAYYYWDINPQEMVLSNTTQSSIIYYFIQTPSNYVVLSNITFTQPMNILLFTKIGVSNVIPKYAPNVTVSYYDLSDGIFLNNVMTYYSNGYLYANLTTNYFMYGHTYRIEAILANPYYNLSKITYVYYNFTINIPSVQISVSSISSSTGPFMNGSVVPIYVNFTVGPISITNLNIVLQIPMLNIQKVWVYNATPGEFVSVIYYLNTSILPFNNRNAVTVTYYVYVTYPQIYPYYVVLYSNSFTVFERPELTILQFTYIPNNSITYISSLNELNIPIGVSFEIKLSIENTGGWTAIGTTYINITLNGTTIFTKTVNNITPGQIVNVYYNLTVNNYGLTPITAYVNYTNIVQKVPGPKSATFYYYGVMPQTTVFVSFNPSPPYQTGQSFTVSVMIENNNATRQQGRIVYMKNVPVDLYIGPYYYTGNTGESGVAIFSITVKSAGNYPISIRYSVSSSVLTYNYPEELSISSPPISIPLWIIAIIVVIIVIVGFFGYSYMKYKKVEKNLMVCGNCGSLIPADADKCPVCGVVFEKENVKCGNCGSWIKKDAKYCPVCGVVYAEETDPEYQKLVEYKKEYDLEIQKYKDEAKRDLGDKFSDEEFYKWWSNKPEFMTFERFLERKGEESGPTVICPVCGTPNPKGSKYCKVCGSPLPQEEKK
ncbi:MAG: zinc-ribbon domain-containing protein [Thermoplasmata archaeon]